MKPILLGLILIAAPAFATPVTTPLISTNKTITGQTIVAPEHPTVISTVITFQPGDKTVEHKHPWPHYGYMLEGTLTITNTETGQAFDLRQGEFLVEMQNTAHFGENRGRVPVKILIIDTVPAGMTNNTIPMP